MYFCAVQECRTQGGGFSKAVQPVQVCVLGVSLLFVRNLAGQELVRASEEGIEALADAHGSIVGGLEQLLSPLLGQPCFRLKLLC